MDLGRWLGLGLCLGRGLGLGLMGMSYFHEPIQ